MSYIPYTKNPSGIAFFGSSTSDSLLRSDSRLSFDSNSGRLLISGVAVSTSGHQHQSSDITNFASSVSGLIPVKGISAGTGIVLSSSSGNFTINVSGNFGLTGEEVDDRVSGLLIGNSGISLTYDDLNNRLFISTSGLQPSGNYSVVGHTHTSSNITDFNESVSGLLPRISNSGNNRILTSAGSTVGINAESYLTFGDGNDYRLTIAGNPAYTDGREILIQTTNEFYNRYYDEILFSNNLDNAYIRCYSQDNVFEINSNDNDLKLVSQSNITIDTNGNDILCSGAGLFLNDVEVSLFGHQHVSTDITNFNSSVSGLISGIYAPLNSPTLTGIPLAPTAPSGTNTNQIASTAFVRNELSNLVDSAPSTLDTLNELAAALGDDANFSTTVTNLIAGKVSKTGDTMTGNLYGPSGYFTNLFVNNVPVSISGHSHSSSDIIDFASGVDSIIDTALVAGSYINTVYDSGANTLTISATGLQPSGNYSLIGHSHVINDVSGLQVALDSKQPSGIYASGIHTHISSDITNFDSSVSGLLPLNIATGIGSSGHLARWTSNNTISSGLIYDDLSAVYITKPDNTGILQVSGTSAIANIFSNKATNTVSALRLGHDTSSTGFITWYSEAHASSTLRSSLLYSAPSGMAFIAGTTSINNPALYINSNRYVGIGRYTPAFQLDVIGTGNFSQNLLVNNIPVSVSGHTHFSANIIDFNSTVSGLLPTITGSGYVNSSFNNNIYTISVSGLQPSGNYSLIGHSHVSSDITNFDSSVSGLLPVKNILSGSGISVSSVSGVYTINSIVNSVDEADTLVTTVFNNTGSQIPKMSAVYINGGQGDQPTIALASASGEMTSSKTYAVTAEAIDNMSSGKVVVAGRLGGLNTDQFNPNAPQGNINGTTLWLSPFVPGALTTVKHYAPYHMVAVATVVRTHQNEGVIEVRIQNGFELDELHNVSISGVSNGQFLQYNSASGLWLASNSGNFTQLSLNGTGVSVNGHSHVSSDITDFNSSVSGLLPNISGSGNVNTSFANNTYIISVSGLQQAGNYALLFTGSPSDPFAYNSFVDRSLALWDIANDAMGLMINDNSVQLGPYNSSIDPTDIRINFRDVLQLGSAALSNSGDFAPSGHTHSSVDITNFNSSVSGLFPANLVTGVGTSGYVSRWNGTNTLTSGVIFDNGTRVGIANTNPQYALDVSGSGNFLNGLAISGVPIAEVIDDEVAGLLVAGSGISLNYNDSSNSLTVDTNVSTSLVAGSGISLAYNVTTDELSINTSAAYAPISSPTFSGTSAFANATFASSTVPVVSVTSTSSTEAAILQIRGRTSDGAGFIYLTNNAGSSNNGFLTGFNGTLQIYGGGYSGPLTIGNTGLLNSQPTYDTTAAGSTVVVTSAGDIRRTSSSIKYKKDIEDLDPSLVSNAVDNLRPVWYRTKNPVGDDKSNWSQIGLIAEEAALVEPRIVRYRTVEVQTSGEMRTEIPLQNPEPEDIDYGRLSVLLLAEIKQLKNRISQLESQINNS